MERPHELLMIKMLIEGKDVDKHTFRKELNNVGCSFKEGLIIDSCIK